MSAAQSNDAKQRLAARFAAIRERSAERLNWRRRDFKGERGRLSLRVAVALLVDLEMLKLAGGGDKNSFCETALAGALARRLSELRGSFTSEEWEAMLDQAASTRSEAREHD